VLPARGRVVAWALVCLAAALPATAGETAAAVTRTVRAAGLAPLVGGDRAASLAQARRAALRQAVEEGVGVLVSSATRVENFAVIADQILTETTGYVRRYHVLEEAVEDGMCRAVVEAEVDLGNLHRDLAGLQLALSEAGNPRVHCRGRELVCADGRDEEVAWGVLQAELARTLEEVAQGRFRLVLPPDEGDAGADGAASLVVSGTARVTPVQVTIPFGSSLDQTGLRAAAAGLEVRVRWSDTGELVASVAAAGRAVAPTWRGAAEKAIRKSVAAAGDSLVARLAEEVRRKAFSRRSIVLRVRAPLDLLTAFEEELPHRITAVEQLERQAYAEGLGLYDLQGRAAGFDLARALSATGMEVATVEITHASTNTLSLALTRRKLAQP